MNNNVPNEQQEEILRKEIEAIIQKVRNYMWTHYKVKFQD